MLLGVNGAGKSSLLNAIAGQYSPRDCQGHIMLGSEPLITISAKKRATRVALLSQHTSVMFPYQVRDIMDMGRYAQCCTSLQYQKVFDYVVENLHLQSHIDCPYHTLSDGQKQRVQLARVILQLIADDDQKIERWLLLDEHVSNLDAYYQFESFKFIQQIINHYNIGVISAVHDMNVAARFSDNLLLINKGKLVLSGCAKEVLLSDVFKQAFRIDVKYIADGHFYTLS